ncbi:TetR family transcriptional regulator [Weissella oryzae SG25]|uniref:TetR family transcriptional regulator n=1 Tax=Weissella oryzae (strain DSM 25784 / JCM 18191 / LMG 30913 / SG25) TaxID=1329250 RepID=A0A069D2G4_WEIOS|nr:TetR/AcrR family transcriptional regulator [Weissella oryzae]GAK31621.1 TetR family transcriptional regulator [Weissella oryzae SG25]
MTNNQRRRGEDLKAAIYEAATWLLENEGYEKVTFQNVARRAHTTRSVLYRYWDDVYTLIYEAAHWYAQQSPDWQGTVMDATFNSGSLRQDLIDMLTFTRKNAHRFPKGFLPFIAWQQTQGRKALAEQIGGITTGNIIIIERILARAQERGEAREDIPQSAKLLPFQQARYFIMFEGQAMTDDETKNLVDEILLPLYQKVD